LTGRIDEGHTAAFVKIANTGSFVTIPVALANRFIISRVLFFLL
jgi:hypothetical protein